MRNLLIGFGVGLSAAVVLALTPSALRPPRELRISVWRVSAYWRQTASRNRCWSSSRTSTSRAIGLRRKSSEVGHERHW